MTLHSATIASIQPQGVERTFVNGIVYRCGCDFIITRSLWRLCQYHQGYEDALDHNDDETETP